MGSGSSPIQFVDDTADTALSDVIGDYQSLTGRTLGTADPEMLLCNSFAYRIALLRTQFNTTGNQNLISFASGAALDQLGMKSGTYRLIASAAVVTIEFTMATSAPTLVIPAGTRIKSGDGLVIFATNAATNVPSGTATIDVDCTCLTAGAIGNGYIAGLIYTIVDPVPYVSSAVNTNTSGGGADAETDDQLRARIPLANATYSVAGPEDAYIYFAQTASPSIVDVSTTVAPVAGGIQASTMGTPGTGWNVGDEFTINTGAMLAQGQITGASGGVPTSYILMTRGGGYSVGSGIATTAITGSGVGLTINITSVISFMTISIYPLLAGGALPNQAMLDAVLIICSDQKVRPLSDTVVAIAPTAVNFSLTVNLSVYESYNSSAVAAQVLANLQGFTTQWNNALGVDLIANQFIGQCMILGVYDVAIPTFTTDVSIANNEFGNCTSITVNVIAVVAET